MKIINQCEHVVRQAQHNWSRFETIFNALLSENVIYSASFCESLHKWFYKKVTLSRFHCIEQWQIQGAAKDAHLQVQFSYNFRGKLAKILGWCSYLEISALWEILDPSPLKAPSCVKIPCLDVKPFLYTNISGQFKIDHMSSRLFKMVEQIFLVIIYTQLISGGTDGSYCFTHPSAHF